MPKKKPVEFKGTEWTASTSKEELIYYCLFCSDSILLSDADLESLPSHESNYVIDEDVVNIKFNTVPGPNILIQRFNGFELRRKLNCPSCGLEIGFDQPDSKFVYIRHGSLTREPIETIDQGPSI